MVIGDGDDDALGCLSLSSRESESAARPENRYTDGTRIEKEGAGRKVGRL